MLDHMTTLQKLIWLRRFLMARGDTRTLSGPVVSFTASQAAPLEALFVDILPAQAGSGDPSPDNVRALTGWTGAKITRTGENLLGGAALKAAMQAYVNTTEGDDYVAWTTSATAKNNGVTVGLRFKANTRYTFTMAIAKSATATTTVFRVYYTDGTYDAIGLEAGFESNQKETVTFVSAAGKTVARLAKVTTSGSARLYYNESGIFEGVLTAQDYAAYNGTTYTVDWTADAGTVYGGKLDAGNGVLTVYPYYASYNGEALVGPWVSSMDVYAPGNTPTVGAQVVDFGGAGDEYQLTAQAVDTLTGRNNVWADTGDVTVTYRR